MIEPDVEPSKLSDMNSDLKQLVERIETGDPSAAELLLPLVYDELRKLALSKIANEKPGQTLQATALVHEAYLRITEGNEKATWANRGHFFAAAAEAMRRILVEQARRKGRLKHGVDWERVDITDVAMDSTNCVEDIEALDAALHKLKEVDATAAEFVQLRYFAGLQLDDIAQIMNISTRTANRIWAFARAWIYREMH